MVFDIPEEVERARFCEFGLIGRRFNPSLVVFLYLGSSSRFHSGWKVQLSHDAAARLQLIL